jgi:hypothetical protein
MKTYESLQNLKKKINVVKQPNSQQEAGLDAETQKSKWPLKQSCGYNATKRN